MSAYVFLQLRVARITASSDVNKEKRREFAMKLLQHQRWKLDLYYYETNFNLYCKRTQGKVRKGEQATVITPPSKGPNVQIQCAVSSLLGVVHYRLERGSVRMDQNASFVEEIYEKAKSLAEYRVHHTGK